MKIEKRTAGFTEEELEEQNAAGEETEVSQQPEEVPAGRKKPVLTYILILFIVAFLLMAMSFAMHQRSNTEAMTQLQSSVNAIQETQRTQEKIIEVQDALRQKEEELEALEQSTAQEREAQQKQIDAQSGITPPAQRYLQLKEAIEAQAD